MLPRDSFDNTVQHSQDELDTWIAHLQNDIKNRDNDRIDYDIIEVINALSAYKALVDIMRQSRHDQRVYDWVHSR